MKVKIYETDYKTVKCIALENERIILKIIPNHGGKLQSIFDKSNELEYLYQSPWDSFKKTGYGKSFLDSDVSGFDEMFPTINQCFYQDSPWEGVNLPDHGEVWSLPWKYEILGNDLFMAVHGVRLPYTLEKRIKFDSDNSFIIEYKLENHAPFPMKFIWAAHPLLNIDENSVIKLPENVDKVINVMHDSKRLGEYGKLHIWPVAITPCGQEYDMSRLSPENRYNDKYYINGKMPFGECALFNEKTKNYIKFVFPVDKVPYLGIWVNENGPLLKQCNIALEPCTGGLDSIDIADKFGQLSQVEAFGVYEWFLRVEIGNLPDKGTEGQVTCPKTGNKEE